MRNFACVMTQAVLCYDCFTIFPEGMSERKADIVEVNDS